MQPVTAVSGSDLPVQIVRDLDVAYGATRSRPGNRCEG